MYPYVNCEAIKEQEKLSPSSFILYPFAFAARTHGTVGNGLHHLSFRSEQHGRPDKSRALVFLEYGSAGRERPNFKA